MRVNTRYIHITVCCSCDTLTGRWVELIFLRRISFIRHLFFVDSTKTPVSAFALSRLHCCNSLLTGCPKHLLEKRPKGQNSAANLVLKASKRDNVSGLLRPIHWLPIQARIEHKLSTLCQSFFSDTAPVYLSGLLRVYSPSRQLRWSSDSRTHKLRPKQLYIAVFPMMLFLSCILCLSKLDNQPLHLKPL